MQKEKAERGRLLLEPESVIILRKNGESSPCEDFVIKKVEGCGGSAICYCASHEGKLGKLKEFYPADIDDRKELSFYAFKRSEGNQLIPVGHYTSEIFEQLKTNFINTHRILEEAKNEHAVLNNYTHSFEMFYGYEDGKSASVYIWTPDDYSGERYDNFIEKNYVYLEQDPLKCLKGIIQSIKALSEGICALHSSGFHHLDINVKNFMLKYKGNGEVDTNAIYLFDLNSLNLMDCETPLFAGTTGYVAPEMYYGTVSIRADIYSIGATLYSALMYSAERQMPLYNDELFSELHDMVSFSDVISFAEKSSKDKEIIQDIKDYISEILRLCLAKNRNHRYKCCDDLVKQLDEVVVLIDAASVLNRRSRH